MSPAGDKKRFRGDQKQNQSPETRINTGFSMEPNMEHIYKPTKGDKMIFMPSDAMDDPMAIFYVPNFDPSMLGRSRDQVFKEVYEEPQLTQDDLDD